MTKRQLIGLAAAAVAFVTIGSASMLAHKLIEDVDGISLLDITSDFYSDYVNADSTYDSLDNEFIATVYVDGKILRSYTENYQDDDYAPSYYDHQWTLDYIDEIIDNDSNEGLLIYVDSPGGGVYESDQLYLKLMEYKEETGRPVWAYLASEACSGGYYVAMASDKIYCNRNGLIGSIGVVMSFLDYSKYMDDVGVSEINITSGTNKTMGRGTQEITEEQREIFQSLVDESYEQFVDVVTLGRGMENEKVRELADGRIYSPKQALDFGLIDSIATFEETEQLFKEQLGIEDAQLRRHGPLRDSRQVQIQDQGNRRLMYYAKPNF